MNRRGFLSTTVLSLGVVAAPAVLLAKSPKHHRGFETNAKYDAGDTIEPMPGMRMRCLIAGKGAVISSHGFQGRALFVPA